MIHTAKGSTTTNDKGEVVVTEKPEPGVYIFLPFAVASDVVTSPFQAVAAYLAWSMARGFP